MISSKSRDETKACVGQQSLPPVVELLPGLNLLEEPLEARIILFFFSIPFFLPFADSDAELEFPFKVGQRPLSFLLLPHSLSTSLCLPGTVPYVIPI